MGVRQKKQNDTSGAVDGRAVAAEARGPGKGKKTKLLVRLWKGPGYDWRYEVFRLSHQPTGGGFVNTTIEEPLMAEVWCEDSPEALADIKAWMCREVVEGLELTIEHLRERSSAHQEPQ